MPYKLISLVFLLFFLIANKASSENEFILPIKKPSVFKKIEKGTVSKTINDLPQKNQLYNLAFLNKKMIKKKKKSRKKQNKKKKW